MAQTKLKVGTGNGRIATGIARSVRYVPAKDGKAHGVRFDSIMLVDPVTKAKVPGGLLGWVGSDALHGSLTLSAGETDALLAALGVDGPPSLSDAWRRFTARVAASGTSLDGIDIALPAVPKVRRGRKGSASTVVATDDAATIARVRASLTRTAR